MTGLKKKFGGPSRRQEQLGKLRGLEQAASMLDAPLSPDSGDMRVVPIDEVRVDPNNPRRLDLDWNTVQQDPETIDDTHKRQEVEEIRGLSLTLASVGQRSPCEVVRDAGRYRLVFGERRYWASRLAGLSQLKVIVLRAEPENIALVQLIENIHHRQLPLYETILNIRSVIAREAERGKPVLDATDLINRTGLARTSAYRYWQYVDLPRDVEEALENRVIRSREELSALLGYSTARARKAALARYIANGSWERATEEPVKRSRRGRPVTKFSFGTTQNGKVARLLFQRIDPEGTYSKLDWDDPTVVTRAFKKLLKDLERQVADED